MGKGQPSRQSGTGEAAHLHPREWSWSLTICKNNNNNWNGSKELAYSSLAEHLPSMCEALHLISSAAERKMMKDIELKTVTVMEGGWQRCHTCPTDCRSGAISFLCDMTISQHEAELLWWPTKYTGPQTWQWNKQKNTLKARSLVMGINIPSSEGTVRHQTLTWASSHYALLAPAAVVLEQI